ncbi:MAG: hypothetical protein V4710_15845 [Verrucomicrobiota bacterium]
MAGALAQFKKEVAVIVEAVAPDLRTVTADQAVSQLQTRLIQTQKNAAQRRTLQKQLHQEHEQL